MVRYFTCTYVQGATHKNGNSRRGSGRQDFPQSAGDRATRWPAELVNSESWSKNQIKLTVATDIHQEMVLGGWFSRSKQDTAKNDTSVQEPHVQAEADAREPSTDPPSVHEPLVLSPNIAKEFMLDLPDRSTEDAASIVNDLALKDVSTSSPKPVSGKRKRQEDVIEGSSKKRFAKESRTSENEDEPPATSTNGITGHEGISNRASSEVVQVAPRKLSRPKKEQRRRHMVQICPATQKSDDIWDPTASPKEQVENPAPTPTSTTRHPQSIDTTPRRRGRPPRVGLPATKKMTLTEKSRKKKPQDLQGKPSRERRPEEYVTPEIETQEGYESPTTLPQKVGPKPRPKASKTRPRDNHKERGRNSKSTNSTTAANDHKDVVSDTNAKHPGFRVRNGENLARARTKEASNRVQNGKIGDFEISPRLQTRGASAEHEGGAGAGEQPEREGNRDSGEVADMNGRNSTQMDEGQRGEAEVEGEEPDVEDPILVKQTEDEDEGEEELELFGQDRAWKKALKGARSLCGSNLKRNQMPKFLTKRIKDIVHDVSEAMDLYKRMLVARASDQDLPDEVNDELSDSLNIIENQIKMLSEKSAKSRAPETKTDVYARAIPAMVFLLQSALACRVYHSVDPCDLETLNETVTGLKEIIRLQKMTILLCEKVTQWKAKPVLTNRPVVRPTTREMLPSLRDMTGAFSKNLLEQDRKRKMMQNAVDHSRRQKELAESSQQAKSEAARKGDILYRKIQESREQEDQRRRAEKRTYRQIREDEARKRMGPGKVNGLIESRTTWSDAEDLALYFQLEKGYAGDLTSRLMRSHLLCHCCWLTTLAAAERYLNLLNTPLLQNKLPEHIRERALYFKPTLLEERGALEWISSIE